jgi:thiamine biosynthesis lipoprotein
MKIYIYITISYAIASFLLLSPSLGQVSSDETLVRTQILMGDVAVTLTLDYASKSRDEALDASSGAFRLAQEIEREVSEHRTESQTSLLNRKDGLEKIGPHFLHLLLRSREISRLTQGLFDITFASSMNSISYRDVEVDPLEKRARLKKKGMRIGLSGIAKGYIVDSMAGYLRHLGFRRFLINAGGDIWAESPNDSLPWSVALFNHEESFPSYDMALNNVAVATSGLYERGRHIINPHTSRAVPNHIAAVTVMAHDTETADALATAAYVAGDRIDGLLERVLEIYPETRIILTQADGKRHIRGNKR